MKVKYIPKLKKHHNVPDFHLPATDGSLKTISYFKQRSNVVLYFFEKADCNSCQAKLKTFKSKAKRFDDLNTIVFAISSEPIEKLKKLKSDLELPFELLSDADLKVSTIYTYKKKEVSEVVPSIFVIDKFNSLRDQVIVHKDEGLPSIQEIIRLLLAIEIECPECGFFPGSTGI